MTDAQLAIKNKNIRALSEKTYKKKLMQFKIEDLVDFQGEMLAKINEMIHRLNLKKT